METDNRTLYFLSFVAGFTLGIFISSFFFIQPLIGVLIISVGLALLLPRESWVLPLLVISFGLGTIRYAVKDFHEIKMPESTGVVVSEPEDRENSRRFVMLADNNERVLVNVPLYTPVKYGDRIIVTGKLEKPGLIDSPAGEFDYGKYLAKDDIYWTLDFASIEVVSHGEGNTLKSALFRIKRNFVEHIKRILPEPHASLLSGLLVAGKDSMPKDILEEFRRAGVVHIVVLSGFNIMLIADFLRKVTFFVFPRGALTTSVIGIILFTIMTGAEATIVRAAIMALIVILAKGLGRGYSVPRALALAGFLMLLQNPKILVFDASFQLSFLATLGMIYFVPVIEKRLKWITEKGKLRETISQTLGTQAAVFPLLILSVGSFSPVFLPANVLILPLVPWTMLIGFLTTLLSYTSVHIALPLAFVSHLMLSWILFVANLLGSF